MWIKICANTNLEDALLAAELGADAVGFVFAPSKRQVHAGQVAAIVAKLPDSLEKIGVFATRNATEIVDVVQGAHLTGVQLHGGFDLELARRLRRELSEAVSITQTIHWQAQEDSSNVREVEEQLEAISFEPAIHRVLVDSKSEKGAGGTGVHFDWTAAHQTLSRFKGKLILAGGLRSDNVVAGIAALHPWGVDVASGVEAEPGRKDAEKLMQFINRTRLVCPEMHDATNPNVGYIT